MIIRKYSKFLETLNSISDMWEVIPQSVKELHTLFHNSGKKLYLVGGSVRDFLTGDKPKDFDLATDALPDEVLKIVKGYKTNLQGKAFGVVVVYTNDQPEGMEIATFREDVSKGRNPEVKLGVTIDQDVKRRDLTYNALFYDLAKREIVDLTGGKKDLESGVTKMVGNAIERFDEDSLRILRAFRFASRYNHPLEKSTEEAILKRPQLENIDPETGEMKRISQERVWEEFKKAWKQAKDFRYYLSFFDKFNMWEEAFPGIGKFCGEHKKVKSYVDSKNFIVVLSHIFHLVTISGKNEDIAELEKAMVENWKIEITTASKVAFLIRLMGLTPDNAPEMYKSRVRCNIDRETIQEWIRIKNFNMRYIVNLYDKFIDYKPSNFSTQLMNNGFKPGKALGEEIKKLEVEEFKKLLK